MSLLAANEPFTDLRNIAFRQSSDDYMRIRDAIEFLTRNWKSQPEIDEVAAHIGLSASHFSRAIPALGRHHAQTVFAGADDRPCAGAPAGFGVRTGHFTRGRAFGAGAAA